jgi:hypothetical protein
MTQPMSRDELARHLCMTTPDPMAPLGPVAQWEQEVLAKRWDNGGFSADVYADYYARADQMIAEGAIR